MTDELVFLCYTEVECERTIDLENELLYEKDAVLHLELMGDLNTLSNLALDKKNVGIITPCLFYGDGKIIGAP